MNSVAVQTDGKVVIGGAFTSVNGAAREVARLTSMLENERLRRRRINERCDAYRHDYFGESGSMDLLGQVERYDRAAMSAVNLH
jgi:hypothetical protein